ncbi:MAG: hypothetical protein ACFE9T_16275 [Promethearchaeota archaeon]
MEISAQEHSLKYNEDGNYISPDEDIMKILRDLNDKWWAIDTSSKSFYN